jgi:2-amino-4-hydroxy-6-hydroxymethyldihydropteridine diphosphokinase/dihydropteroate synthase
MIILGIGSNLNDRLANLRLALKLLRQINGLTIIKVSPVYESDALLAEDAPIEWHIPYLNAAISCTCELNPSDLVTELKAIEIQIGRAKDYQRWSPRIIDIDILAWNEELIQTERLKIPHAGLCDRPFAIWPLADLAPNWRYCVPNNEYTGKTAAEIVVRLGSRFSSEAPLHTHQINHRIDTPQMVGILNVTSDSFSDGGEFFTPDTALNQAQKLFADGADIIDIGAESTRPNSLSNLTPELEWQKLEPILATLTEFRKNHSWFQPKISIDTKNPTTAQKAIAEFAVDWINDVTGCDNPVMRAIIAANKTKIAFMHHLGIPPSNKIILSSDQDSVLQICAWAKQRIAELLNAGVKPEQLIFDPGIGFGKSAAQSLELIKRVDEFTSLGLPILIGHSRKSFLSQFTNKPFAERDIETAVLSNYLAQKNIAFLRVHAVGYNMRAIKINMALK